MALSASLISSLVKTTNDSSTSSNTTSTTVYGTARKVSGTWYVLVDGSEQLVPVSSTATLSDGDRVMMVIENHSATVTGNLTDQSASSSSYTSLAGYVDDMNNTIIEQDNYLTLLANTIYIEGSTVTAENALITIEDGSVKIQGVSIDSLNDTVNTQGNSITAIENTLSLYDSYISISDGNISISGVDITALNSAIEVLESEVDIYNSSFQITDGVVTGIVGLDGVTYITVEDLTADHEKVGVLEADFERVTSLEAELANINSLLAGNVGAGEVETIKLTTDNAVIDEAVITTALVNNEFVGTLLAGVIYTSLVTIQTGENDRGLYMSDSLIAMYDENDVQRLQAGQAYESEGYNFVIWDADKTVLFNATGVTAEGIPSETIVDAHVASNAAISGEKLNIKSVIQYIENDGSLTVDYANVQIDNTTLDVWYSSINSDIDGLNSTTSDLQTQLNVVNGDITAKVWQTDIDSAVNDLNEEITTLTDSYAGLAIDVDTVTQEVGTLSTWSANLSIGGTQLLRGTNSVTELTSTGIWDNATWRSASSGTGTRTSIEVDDAPNGNIKVGWSFTCTSTSTTLSSNSVCIGQNDVPITVGETYTMSCYARGTGILTMFYGISVFTNNFKIEIDSDTWARYSYTFEASSTTTIVSDGLSRFFFGAYQTSEIEICGMKLEKGTVATDWSEAPEDTSSALSALDLVLYGTDSDEEDDTLGLIATLDALGANTETILDMLYDSIDEDGTTVMGLVSSVSELTSSVDSITAKVEDTVQLLWGDDETEGLETKLTSLIDQTSTKVTISLSQYITSLSNTIYGSDVYELSSNRNYLRGTATAISQSTTATSSYTVTSIYTTGDISPCALVATAQADDTVKTLGDFGFTSGDEVTLSFDWEISDASTYGNFRAEWYGVTSSSTVAYIAAIKNPVATFSEDNTSGHFEITVTLTDTAINASGVRFRIDNSYLTLTISNVKLEAGDTATDWTAAPEDTEADSLSGQVAALSSYFDFSSDGLRISASNSTLSLLLANDKISFIDGSDDDADEVAFISDSLLHIHDAYIDYSLQIGRFKFIPRDTGNLSIVYVGDEAGSVEYDNSGEEGTGTEEEDAA